MEPELSKEARAGKSPPGCTPGASHPEEDGDREMQPWKGTDHTDASCRQAFKGWRVRDLAWALDGATCAFWLVDTVAASRNACVAHPSQCLA